MTKDKTTPLEDSITNALDSDEAVIEKVSLDIELLFKEFRDGNEPLESVVKGTSRRSKEFEEKKVRAQRLASLLSSMTPMQQRFVTHYVAKDWDSLSEVMIRAGSTAKGDALRQVAHHYLKKPEIKEVIVLMTLRKLEAEGIDRYEVIAMLRDTYNGAMADGKYKEAKDSAELLGTAVGMFTPNKARTDLTKNEVGQLGELNRISRQAGLADPKPPEELANAPSRATVDTTTEELKNQLKIAGTKSPTLN